MFKANLKWIKTKSNHVNSETKKAFTSDYSQVRLRLCERKEGWKYPCYTAFTITVVNTNAQPQLQSVSPFMTLPKYIPQQNQCGSKQRKRKQGEKQEHFTSYWWKSLYLFIRQVSDLANTGLLLVYHN